MRDLDPALLMTLPELARSLAVSPRTIRRWLAGQGTPPGFPRPVELMPRQQRRQQRFVRFEIQTWIRERRLAAEREHLQAVDELAAKDTTPATRRRGRPRAVPASVKGDGHG